ncbi:uncharacterized protein BO88DRAFT_80338 [Aspergillus vadensis CBS 113365]|uniref:Uncharacterized protein n=1 Tax=Aspergillus vadensis (strain CBS 113365 / IMI 142717 / IBT 24658) TaxID=1448311 RepID=A0A319B4C8_ASPVC|nr:hypothetical protein BO88DRAFT_80338 [Aspergillus vadensis CBS 113365]PYH67329.1 hypothetical protein BO88DRAFT_80338 [Aspergillus vadensis CBS 113365]
MLLFVAKVDRENMKIRPWLSIRRTFGTFRRESNIRNDGKSTKGGGKRVERTVLVVENWGKHCLHRICSYESRCISFGRETSSGIKSSSGSHSFDVDRLRSGPNRKISDWARPQSRGALPSTLLRSGTPTNRGDNAQYAAEMEKKIFFNELQEKPNRMEKQTKWEN